MGYHQVVRVRVRSRILAYVVQHPRIHADDIARALGMKAPAVRHHLMVLRSDGRLEVAAADSAPGRGRPRLAYRISPELAGNNLGMLVDHLLEAGMKERAGRRGAGAVVAGLAQRLGRELQPPQPISSATQRLAALVEGLNRLHYRAHWEAGAEGPHVIFGQCPYAAVIQRHPELCQMDAQAIASLMKAGVHQKAKIAPSGAGASSCVFAVKSLSAGAARPGRR